MKRNLSVAMVTLAGASIAVGASVESLSIAINKFATTLPAGQQDELRAIIEKVTGEPMTAQKVACDALLMQGEDERNMAGTEKVKRFKLAQRIFEADGDFDITAEEMTMLKSCVAKAFTPLIVGQVFSMLENELRDASAPAASA